MEYHNMHTFNSIQMYITLFTNEHLQVFAFHLLV